MTDTPDYLEAPDNEDSEAICDYCYEPACDDGLYPDLCLGCNEEAARYAYYERLAEEREDREMFPEDYSFDW